MTPEEYAQFAADLIAAFLRKNIAYSYAIELTGEVLRGVARQKGAVAG